MESRTPTYGSAVRMAELIVMLSKSWRPMPVDQICEYFSISYRTAQRYRKALNENLTAGDGGNFMRVIKEGGVEKWYLADQEEMMTATFFRIVSVYVATVLLKSMKGTVIEAGMNHLWEMVAGQLKPSIRTRVESFDQKIRYSGFGRKDYSQKSGVIEGILKGLVHQSKVQILHHSHSASREKYHIIHPYTLLLHRDALYVHAYDEGYEEIRTFSIDRIEQTVNIDAPFKYPVHFNPDTLTDGSFGIFTTNDDQPSSVLISFKEALWEYITTRRWHPSQTFSKKRDGGFTMEIHLKNTQELVPWILQFGGDARVLEPESLRDKIKQELMSACEKYPFTGFSVQGSVSQISVHQFSKNIG